MVMVSYGDHVLNTDKIFVLNVFKECMSDFVTNYNYVGDTQKVYRLKTLMPTNAH